MANVNEKLYIVGIDHIDSGDKKLISNRCIRMDVYVGQRRYTFDTSMLTN